MAYAEGFQFEIVKVVPFAKPANKTASNTFRIDIRVQTLNNVAGGVPDLPYKFGNETFRPAHTLKGKFAPDFVLYPV
jgi:hypothetical protein